PGDGGAGGVDRRIGHGAVDRGALRLELAEAALQLRELPLDRLEFDGEPGAALGRGAPLVATRKALALGGRRIAPARTGNRGIRRRRRSGTTLQPGGIVVEIAIERLDAPVVYAHEAVHARAQQVAVVRNQQERSVELGERLRDGVAGRRVEMVR